mmetsp:Transcript_3983/g.11570  ORF Transcript_3983/g.11570 Transcript_3983/m.11570 type:complete len:383 (+) Transcript_3983:109-1257(+)|eukprot:CAMPEP_0206139230 /NCGR_PEP_ID=MMETSP1473-20131121/5070_1 /ASSEMBLY_ACC=CAM_ASM_001109 /TAXON_ID=1461547 /ORGANISM="Stichococcus sp, Strain RCC1054" /LENGTH=382 /DNA_ID=CAMNT_0053532927 /DNA_START=81 /DNA_END=1229 /DNA_ORIENTATION=-
MFGFQRPLALAGLALCCLLQIEAATVSLYDGTGSIVKSGASQTVLTPDGVSTLLSALLRTEASVAPLASRQVEGIVSSDLRARPEAVVAIQVLGAGEDGGRITLDAAKQHTLKLDAGATQLLKSVAAAAGPELGSIDYLPLDHTTLDEECRDTCQELLVQDVMLARGYNYTSRTQPSLDCDLGPWCYWVDGPEGHVLDMDRGPDRLLAMELATLRKAALEAAAARTARNGPADKPQLLEATLVGLQALHSTYGSDSTQVRAAKSMLAGTLQEVWAALHAAHGGRVVVHLAAPDLADTRRSPDVPEMLQWRASHRTVFQRHLLQQQGKFVATEVGAVSFLWATSSVAWLMSIILVVTIISASLCLCGMSFEQDTLLYARPKAD